MDTRSKLDAHGEAADEYRFIEGEDADTLARQIEAAKADGWALFSHQALTRRAPTFSVHFVAVLRRSLSTLTAEPDPATRQRPE